MPTQVKSFAQPAIGSILYTLAVVLYAMSAAVLAMLAVPLFSLLVAVSAAGPTARDETVSVWLTRSLQTGTAALMVWHRYACVDPVG